MLRNFLVLLLFALFLTISAESQTYKRSIKWFKNSEKEKVENDGFKEQSNANESFIHFREAIYPNPETMVPHFFELIPVSSNVTSIEQIDIQVTNRVYEPLPTDETILKQEAIGPDFNFEYNIGISRKKSFLEVEIPALVRNLRTSSIERLVSFDIVLRYNEFIQPKMGKGIVANQSVLASGKWVKIKADKSGVYKLSYSEIESLGLENPENISVWGHNGRQLPYMNNQESLDDLVQIPVWLSKGSDGVFNQGDYALFYLNGPVSWSYDSDKQMFYHSLHDYTEQISYFITTSRSDFKRVETVSTTNLSSNRIAVSYDARMFFERNDTNLIKSGRQWFGESFDVYSTRNYNSGFSNPVANGSAKIAVNVVARSSVASNFYVKANGSTIGSIQLMPVNISNEHADFFSQREQVFSYPYTQGALEVEVTYSKPTPAAKSWLDYITINARQKLQFAGNQLDFRDSESVGDGNITSFQVSNATTDMMIWDVSNIFSTKNIDFELQQGIATYSWESATLSEFIAFTPTSAYSVSVEGEIPNQNIHGELQPEMVVVAHPNFLEQAEELAELHFNHSGLKSLVVTTTQVYNEFSSGVPDVGAIRNMMRMFYNRSTSEADMPQFLLLFGDGSYDNRSVRSVNTNYIPTFQSKSSVNKMYSFVSDDFFGLLDENEGEADGLLDLGIGRIPSSSIEEADVVVRKIDQYMNSTQPASWVNQLTFIGDDQDSNLHMRQANELAQLVESTYPRYNIEKIFFDAFPQVSTTQGNRYPEVTKAINSRANQGALIMNYTGHANAMWLSEEKVLMVSDIISWRNFDRLPLFVTATCEFSRFDDFGRKSAGEYVLFASKGGGVGLVSTTRIVLASSNHTLNMNFYRWVFREREQVNTKNHIDSRYYSLGEVLRYSKINSGSSYNKRSFMLLGDPALKLHYPEFGLQVTAINSTPVSEPLDTLKSLSKVTVSAEAVGLSRSEVISGEAEITLFDKSKNVTTLANDSENPFEFSTRENIIYRGRSSIENGKFEATFIVPKDISYSFGTGRFSLFATGNDDIGSGYFENFIVGGISSGSGNDDLGPEIEIYMNDNKFVPGGITDPNPKLLVFFTDSSGLNTTGSGIGHDLVATLVGEDESSFILNDYYVADINSFQKGRVEYQLTDLKPGKYTLKVKAWDVYNNSSESEIDFLVKTDNNFELTRVLNYPNPFTENTAFYFEHNQPFEPFDVLIQVLSPSGKLVKTLEYFFPGDGSYRIGPIHWDGLDDFGDRIGRGVYFYRVKIRLTNGKTIEKYEKLVNLR